MAEQGTLQAQLEHGTWKVLKHLASSVPEACVHFQGISDPNIFLLYFRNKKEDPRRHTDWLPDAVVYTREEDVGLAGPLFVNPGQEPWWKDVIDDVSSPLVLTTCNLTHIGSVM